MKEKPLFLSTFTKINVFDVQNDYETCAVLHNHSKQKLIVLLLFVEMMTLMWMLMMKLN